MAQPGPPPGGMPPGITPQQIQQMIAMEAQKRGMTVPQFQAFQKQQIEQEAAKAGMSPQQFVQMKQAEAREQYMRQQQAAQQQPQQGAQPGQPQQKLPQPGQPGGPPPGQMQQVPVNGTVEAKPDALAVAKFLRSQNLKTRTCIFNGQRKEMFKVKRAFRALQSPAYEKARTKSPLLPPVTDDASARQVLSLLPLSMLALRVTKKDPHEGHNHAKPKKEKRVKGLWDVKIEQQQEFDPMMHYVWLYEPSQWKTKIWGGLLILAIFAVVMFPLWPLFMRQGVWYLSVGAMGLLGAFFVMSIFRLILFIITYFAVSPGLWLFPNLFEDVGFFDSFKPLWGWQETKKKGKKTKAVEGAAGAEVGEKHGNAVPVANAGTTPAANGTAVATATEAAPSATAVARRPAATVEEADDE